MTNLRSIAQRILDTARETSAAANCLLVHRQLLGELTAALKQDEPTAKGAARIEVTRWQNYPHAASKAGDVCITCGEKWLPSPDGTGIWHNCHT